MIDKRLQICYALAFAFAYVLTNANAQTLEIFELQKKCMAEGKKYFQERKNEITAATADEFVDVEYHFNKKRSICLLRVKRISKKYPLFKGDAIYNVLENKNLFLYFNNYSETEKTFTCLKNETERCITEDEYVQSAQKIMSE